MTGNDSHTHDISIINVPINIIRNNSNGSLSIGCRKDSEKVIKIILHYRQSGKTVHLTDIENIQNTIV